MKNPTILLILLSVFSSCDNKSTKMISNKETMKQESLIRLLDLPQSVIKGENIRGSIEYDTKLDSLLPEDISSRYIFLHLTISSHQKNLSIESIKNEKRIIYEDTIGNGIFNFDIIFEKSGNQVFNGVVEDIMILSEPLEDEDKVRILTKETSISQVVFVKDE